MPAESKASDFTSEELQEAIVAALKARDFDVLPGLIKMLAVVDPDTAEAVLTMLSIATGNGDAGGFERTDHHLPGGGW